MSPTVSRETRDRLAIYVDNLRRWQKSINLVSPASLNDVQARHLDDSAQLIDLASGQIWTDLGSGAGLPGLVVAAIDPAIRMHLVESDSRKCAFLRDTAQRMGLQVSVVEGRIEERLHEIGRIDVVTARALAPLPQLLGYAQLPLQAGAIGLFPKGQRWQDELTLARESWIFASDLIPSATDPRSRIIRIHDFRGPVRPCSIPTTTSSTGNP